MWFDKLLYPFKVAVAWVMVRVHDVLVFLGMDDGAGPAWVLSIIGLTIIVRILIIPLFFKQIKASRGMQVLQPELKKIQDKYKGKKDAASRQRMSEEMTALYREHGTTPFSSCLPILAQMPVFFALFRVLASTSAIAEGNYMYDHLGPLNAAKAAEIESSTVFGAPLSSIFSTAPSTQAKIVIVVLILVMGFTQFYTMRQLTMKNMPESAKDPSNPMMRTQMTMMYTMPVFIAVSGFFFQTGVLIYWLTTNLWTAGQQLWTIERMPTPGSDSYTKLMTKRRNSYIESVRPVFEDFDKQVSGLDVSQAQKRHEVLLVKLAEVKARAKKQKVPTKFPETITEEEQFLAYRELAYSEWETMPDEHWVRRLVIKKRKPAVERVQPERLSKRERQARDEAQRRRENRQAQQERRSRNAGGLSADEIEQRRQERRAQRRRQKKRDRK